MIRTAVSVRLIAGAPVALVDHARAERPGLDQIEPLRANVIEALDCHGVECRRVPLGVV